MTPLEMIAEWRNGCSCAPAGQPEQCSECTRALIEALGRKMREIAAPVGAMHSYWETITCIDMFLKGRPIMGHGAKYTAADWIAEVESMLKSDGH